MAAKTCGRGGARRITKRVYAVGQAVRVATQYDGTILAEIVEIDGSIFVVRGRNGKTYRILSAEIV
jgi:hypothetical protein